MFKAYKKTIKREFFVTGISSALIIAIVFISLLSLSIYYLSIDNARQKLKSASVHLSTYTEGVLESLVISTKTNAGFAEVAKYQRGDLKTRDTILALFAATTKANPNIKFSYAGYTNGDLLIEGYIPPPGYNSTVRPWYTSAVAKYPELSVGLPYQEAKTNEWLVSVSQALTDESGTIVGVIAVDCTLAYVKALTAEVKYYESQSNYVVNGNGVIFVHENPDLLHQEAESIVPGITKLFTQESGYIQYTLDGIQRMAFYQKIKSTDWIIVSAINESEVMNPLFVRIVLIIIALVFLAIILGIAQVKLYERSFVGPITSLRDRIEEITSGKKGAKLDYQYSNSELAEIANGIEDMAETSLRKKAYELKLILESTSDGILVLDLEGKVVHTNAKFKELWGLSTGLRQGDKPNAFSEHIISKNLETYSDNEDDTYGTLHLDNGTVLEQYSCPLMDGGNITGRLWSYRDVTIRTREEEDLRVLATTDSLTGLWNRRYFLEKGAYEIKQVKQTGLPLSLLFIDVDHFKRVNDTYGHAIGDEVLKLLAITLKTHVRSTDIVARLGGEEFCILVANTNETAAYTLAEKLRSYFEVNTFEVKGCIVSYTLSIGIETYDGRVAKSEGIEDLLAGADQACYKAKDLGRNCVVISDMFEQV